MREHHVVLTTLLLAAFPVLADNESGPPHWSEVVGAATVIDGDSLYIGDTEVRLYGVDAFEFEQTCAGEPCGAAAAQSLADIAGRHPVRCVGIAGDSCGRLIAVCRTRGRDLGREQILAGLALADRSMTDDYVTEEAEARAAVAGTWATDFATPWDFRATLATDLDRGCAISRLESIP